MSANITLVYPEAIIVVSDRRVSTMSTGVPLTERSTKLTAFGCADARGLITYNGIGWDDSHQTPSEWLMELGDLQPFKAQSLDQILNTICADTQRRIEHLSPAFTDRRHTFIAAVWQNGQPSVYTISNYESASTDEKAKVARSAVTIDHARLSPGQEIMVFATGDVGRLKDAEVKALRQLVKTCATTRQIKDRCAKMIKDIAYRQKRKGSVGTSVQWAVMGDRDGELFAGLDVPGRTTLDELPNFIGISAVATGQGLRVSIGSSDSVVKDMRIESSATNWRNRYNAAAKTSVIGEAKCARCGGKIPEGYRRCPTCDTPTSPMCPS